MSQIESAKTLSDYERYIRTEELLALQKVPEERSNREELLFQVIHQSMELWLKVVLDEIDRVVGLLDAGDLGQAAHHLRRITLIERHLGNSLEILESMAPADYHVIRLGLGRGSGQESPGFNAVLREAPRLWPAFERARQQTGLSLEEIFEDPRRNWDLWQVIQGLMAMDEYFQTWRFHHYELVKRIIGLEVKSLKGVPASQLRFGVDEAFFPALWEQVPLLTRKTRPEY